MSKIVCQALVKRALEKRGPPRLYYRTRRGGLFCGVGLIVYDMTIMQGMMDNMMFYRTDRDFFTDEISIDPRIPYIAYKKCSNQSVSLTVKNDFSITSVGLMTIHLSVQSIGMNGAHGDKRLVRHLGCIQNAEGPCISGGNARHVLAGALAHLNGVGPEGRHHTGAANRVVCHGHIPRGVSIRNRTGRESIR